MRRARRSRVGRDRHDGINVEYRRRQADLAAARLIPQLQGNVLCAQGGIRESGDFHVNNNFALVDVERSLRERKGMQFALGIGHLADLEPRGCFGAQVGRDQVVRRFFARVDVKAFADFQDHRNLKRSASSHRIERGKCAGSYNVAAGRNLRRCSHCAGDTHEKPRQKRDAESQTVTCSPNCWEITRLITPCRSSPVFSSTNELRASDQPSLKLVESAEIQISRTGVLGETTNLASSGSSKITSSLPLSPSTSKPCASPSVSKRRFNSSKAPSAFR